MNRSIAIFFALAISCSAGETRHFFGTWEPPRSLQEFWAPIDDSWWKTGSTPRLDQRCKNFAKQSRPEVLVPDIITDLKANPSEVRWFVYLNVMTNWNKKSVLHVLAPFQRSRDNQIRHIADEFVADLE
jgi:hypothetical protein